ncbi:hypothetical protein CIT14_17235 [Virgibacillus profundi]|nr:hypothetical protein CIT14_17235 [Virgibacillus profundi]
MQIGLLSYLPKIKKGRTIHLSSHYIIVFEKKIIKKGQTNPVYSVYTNRVFERIQLLVQSRETKSYRVCHFLIILLII